MFLINSTNESFEKSLAIFMKVVKYLVDVGKLKPDYNICSEHLFDLTEKLFKKSLESC